MKQQVVLLIVALSATSTFAKSRELTPYAGYDCSLKPNGNYEHPSDCTKFISCSNGYAHEMDCPACHISEGPDRCPEGKLHFYLPADRCEWAFIAQCSNNGSNPSTEKPRPPTTEEPRPPTSDRTTQPPADTTTEAPVTSDPIIGEPCNPNDCKHVGDCTSFKRCNKTTSVYDEINCDGDLYWDPDVNADQTGGSCNEWDRLSEAVQSKYMSDEKCFPPCYYKENGSCSNTFLFHETNSDHREIETLKCPPTLLWDQNRETCGKCSTVRKDSNDSSSDLCCADEQ